jgi:hypothetical protein
MRFRHWIVPIVVKVLLAPAIAMLVGFMSFSMGLPAIHPPNSTMMRVSMHVYAEIPK